MFCHRESLRYHVSTKLMRFEFTDVKLKAFLSLYHVASIFGFMLFSDWSFTIQKIWTNQQKLNFGLWQNHKNAFLFSWIDKQFRINNWIKMQHRWYAAFDAGLCYYLYESLTIHMITYRWLRIVGHAFASRSPCLDVSRPWFAPIRRVPMFQLEKPPCLICTFSR